VRITIFVSEQLNNELKKLGKEINISAVCQKALQEEITFYKNIKEVKGMEKNLVKWRKQKEDSLNFTYNDGLKESTEWAKGMDYNDIKEYSTKALGNLEENEWLTEQIQELSEEEQEKYLEGFQDGLRAILQKI